MSDLIDRQEAIDALYGITAYKNSIPLYSAIFNIKKLPSAQPKTGRWMPVGDSGVAVRFYKCSRCGCLVMGSGRNYCADCGARMMEVEHE